jgi:DNA-binding MarR family transcriptional regulator/N-acetylglutamate synthase-like GNAT family acetyltransferase
MTPSNGAVQAVRRFNRFYTRQIGLLQKGLLQSPFSLTEARVLYEVAHRKNPTATEIMHDLGLDRGYLSRILRSFQHRGLIARNTSKHDSRQQELRLTHKGLAEFRRLDKRSHGEVAAMLGKLPVPAQKRLVHALQSVESILGGETQPPSTCILRPHRPGDMGWIIHRHGVLYSQEYGWDERFEALVAEISAKFIQRFDPQRERCWIAETDGTTLGCVLLVKKSKTVAKLRLLLVEPAARGQGIGKRLVDECISFARQAGYKTITLWTNDVLHAARHIYQQAGFHLVNQEPHNSFGEGLVGQTWELTL